MSKVKDIAVTSNLPAMTNEEIERIFKELYECVPLQTILPSAEHRLKFFRHINNNPSLATEYSKAQQVRAEIHVEDIVDIADVELDPQRARVRIDARKWYASKMQPQKYGDRLDLNVTTDVDIQGALAEARSRVRSIRDQSDIEDAQVVEPKEITQSNTTETESDAVENTCVENQNHVGDPFD